MEKFQETFNKWCDVNSQLAKDCKEYIKDTLNKLPNKELVFDDEEVIPASVTYDGGNHPEYAANPYSNVERVYLNNDNIYLDTEDCSGYALENICAEEMMHVAESIQAYIERNIDLED